MQEVLGHDLHDRRGPSGLAWLIIGAAAFVATLIAVILLSLRASHLHATQVEPARPQSWPQGQVLVEPSREPVGERRTNNPDPVQVAPGSPAAATTGTPP